MPAAPGRLAHDTDISPVAALMAERARAAMLTAMLDGRPLAAGELARVAGVSPATASAHLGRLLDGGLVTVIRQGRHRYYRLAGPEVAAAIEALSHLSPDVPVRSLRQSRQAAALAEARTCYDHLAGRAGVALLDALLAGGLLTPAVPATDPPAAPGPAAAGSAPARPGRAGAGRAGNGPGPPVPGSDSPEAGQELPDYEVTEAGAASLAEFGVDTGALRRQRRRFAGACLDWTQRRPHLNGALGAAITGRLLQAGWLEPGPHRRSVRVTPEGREGLAATFGWAES
jgi:DNA-binding transcriptional ArsR family regulator